MVIDMNEDKLVTQDQFLNLQVGTTEVEYQTGGQGEAHYRHIQEVPW